jgi:hypothetical protein
VKVELAGGTGGTGGNEGMMRDKGSGWLPVADGVLGNDEMPTDLYL